MNTETEKADDGRSSQAHGSPVVFIDGLNRPYLAFRGWLHFRSQSNEWITLRELKPGELEAVTAQKLPDEQAAAYGWPCRENDKMSERAETEGGQK